MTDQLKELQEKVASYRDRPNDERIKYIRSPRWIGYQAAEDILKQLATLLAYPKSDRMPNLLIVGDTNNGKTMLAKRFWRKHPAEDNKDGASVVVPVMFMQAPPIPDEGRFYNTILELLFAPYKPGDRIDRKQYQAVRLMREVGLRMLIIDEVHNILAGSLTRQRAFLNVIKFLGNELQIPIIASGTREAFRAIQTDPQLANRFKPAVLPRWKNDNEFGDFLITFENLIPLRKPSHLDDISLSDRIYAMSEGYLGEICRILVDAAVYAVESGRELIDQKALDAIQWVPPSARRLQPEGI